MPSEPPDHEPVGAEYKVIGNRTVRDCTASHVCWWEKTFLGWKHRYPGK
jgi:hypothetical protein